MEKLATAREWAETNGLLSEFAAAMREIDFRLKIEPQEWGESREYLPVVRVQIRCDTSRMVTVLYGVAEDRDVVFVREFRINHRYTSKPPT